MKSTINLYLKTMYLLEIQLGNIRVTDIAKKLNYSKSSVSKALIRLTNNNLIKYESYGDIILSNEAKKIAEELILKENLLEMFFIGILNISDEQARKDVEIISEYVSNETKEKLKNYIIKSLRLNNEKCMCNNQECNNCETKIIQKRVINNQKWLDILKEKE